MARGIPGCSTPRWRITTRCVGGGEKRRADLGAGRVLRRPASRRTDDAVGVYTHTPCGAGTFPRRDMRQHATEPGALRWTHPLLPVAPAVRPKELEDHDNIRADDIRAVEAHQ